MIPAFDGLTGALPLGRYLTSVDEIEQILVAGPAWGASSTRRGVFDDWLQAKDLIDDVSPDLIEGAWLGGSFVTDRLDPDDMDCLFILSHAAFEGLPSNGRRARIRELNKKGKLRAKTGLRVEPFIMVRRVHVSPWAKDGSVVEDARGDLALRGAWDDWWLRVRSTDDKLAPPEAKDAHPVRGYLEVRWP